MTPYDYFILSTEDGEMYVFPTMEQARVFYRELQELLTFEDDAAKEAFGNIKGGFFGVAF